METRKGKTLKASIESELEILQSQHSSEETFLREKVKTIGKQVKKCRIIKEEYDSLELKVTQLIERLSSFEQ